MGEPGRAQRMFRERRVLRLRAVGRVGLLLAGLATSPGCGLPARMGTDLSGEAHGKTFYIGGAGQFGNVGSLDVPKGLRQAGYEGAIQVFAWQSPVSLGLLDQIDRGGNQSAAGRLADEIQDYLDRYPGRPVNIIALSAGTGIATWALEELDEGYRVNTLVFLGSSLSRTYDLSGALRRVGGRLYNYYSTRDLILRNFVPFTGTVDRQYEGRSVAGLRGFAMPRELDDAGRALYRSRVRNMPWLRAYRRYANRGGHTDGTRRSFVRHVIGPLILDADEEWLRRATTQPTTRPATRAAATPR